MFKIAQEYWVGGLLIALIVIGMAYGEDSKKVTQFKWVAAEIVHADLIMAKTILLQGENDEATMIKGGSITFSKDDKIKYMITYSEGLLNIADGKGNILKQFNGQ